MSRPFENPFPVFMLADGVTVNSGGYLKFVEPGAGSVAKKIYADKNLTTELVNPFQLTLQGRMAQSIYLDGDYKVEIQNSSGTKYDETPNYNPADFQSQFADFDATVTYSENDFSRDTNGKYYRSIVGGNVGNDPSSSLSKWEEIVFFAIYNANRTYSEDEIVQFGDDLWVSLEDDNTGNTPSDTSEEWRSFFTPASATGLVSASFEYRNDNGDDGGDAFDVDADVTQDTYESVGPTGSGADHIWDAMDEIPSSASMAILQFSSNGSNTNDSDSNCLISVFARAGGSTSNSTIQQVQTISGYGGSTQAFRGGAINEAVVPLDSSNRFEVRWDQFGFDSPDTFDIKIYVKGYKV